MSQSISHSPKSSKQIDSTKTALSSTASTTERQWLILQKLQRGKWTGTNDVMQHLKMAGHPVSIRTVQRDLNALAKRFLLEKNNNNPQGWRWRNDAPLHSMPTMNMAQAVAFHMVQANLIQLLPPSILNELEPWFELANRQLKDNSIQDSWLSKVKIEPASQPLIPPDIEVGIKDSIYQAVFEQKQLLSTYTKRGQSDATSYRLHPLAIVQRGEVIYLLAIKQGEEEIIRTFALHRFVTAELLDDDAYVPDDFNLTAHLEAGAMGFFHPKFANLPNQGKRTAVKLVFDRQAATSLTESKLSEDQTINEQDDGIEITATLNLTNQLVWWLRGFGNKLKHIEPKLLADVVYERS